MRTIFISDLHLDAQHPHLTTLFFNFLTQFSANTDAIYLLGDIFDAWIGDDACTPFHQEIMAAMRQTAEQGIPLYFIHGNRDFLVGEQLAQQGKFTLLSEAHVIKLYGKQILLLHGDTLCTDDTDYLAFRQQVRNPIFQQQFLAQPIPVRLQMAQAARTASKEKTSTTNLEIMDANEMTVQETFNTFNVDYMIHGHTHRPGFHLYYREASTPLTRIVLSDWTNTGNALVWPSEGLPALIYFS